MTRLAYRIRTGLILALVAFSTPALAGGFGTARFGGEHGHASTADISAVYYNPAGLTLKTGTRLRVEGLVGFRHLRYTRPAGAIDNIVAPGQQEAGTPQEAVNANAGEASLDNLVASPFLGVASDLGIEGLGVGLAFFVPFGGQQNWDKNEEFEGSEQYPGAFDGQNRWASIEGVVQFPYLSFAAAYELPGRLSIGASASWVPSRGDSVRARTADGTDNLVNRQGAITEGRSYLESTANSFAWGAGLLWEAVDDVLWAGVAYQSRPGGEEIRQSGTLVTQFGAGGEGMTPVEFTHRMPDTVLFSVRGRPSPDLELRLFGQWTRWSRYTESCAYNIGAENPRCESNPDGSVPQDSGVIVLIPRQWDDGLTLRGGASYWLNPHWELFGGLGYDQNVVPDHTLATDFIDSDKYFGALGARWQVPDSGLELSLEYLHVFYTTRDVAPRGRDAMGNPDALLPPGRNPDLSGEYKQAIGLGIVSATYTF